MLPCILMFLDGVCCDRIVGFEELGSTDHWKTEVLEKRLLGAHVIKPRERTEDDSDEEEELEQVTLKLLLLVLFAMVGGGEGYETPCM